MQKYIIANRFNLVTLYKSCVKNGIVLGGRQASTEGRYCGTGRMYLVVPRLLHAVLAP